LTLTFPHFVPEKDGTHNACDIHAPKRHDVAGSSSRSCDGSSRSFRRLVGQLDALPDTHPIKVPAAAEMCGVHRTTLWRWIREGLLPRPTKIGNAATFPLGLIRAIQRNGLASKKKADLSLRTGG
jgi:predicted DNA-binding transcriptional regulator AlpA